MIVDINKLFKQYVTAYLVKNKGKIDGNKIQEVTDELYSSFQDTAFDELEGLTPNTYYDNKVDCLEQILSEHVNTGVKINDYLIDALKRNLSKERAIALSNEANQQLVQIGLEVALFNGAKIDDNRLIDLLFDKNTSQENLELCVILLKEGGDAVISAVVEKALKQEKIIGVVCDLLAGSTVLYDEITPILIDGLKQNLDSVPEFCTYLSKHGDESALDSLYEIAKAVTDKIALKEICMTIERLGGDIGKVVNLNY